MTRNEQSPNRGAEASMSFGGDYPHSSTRDVERLSRGESADLQKLIRARSRVAQKGIEAQEAKLNADLEQQLSAIYPPDDPRWATIRDEAAAHVAAVDQQIAEMCERSGIPAEFRPSFHTSWVGRGENATASRRAELRKLGQAKIKAAGKAAKLAIQQAEVEQLGDVLADGLQSAPARQVLDAIPTAEKLMHPIDVQVLEAEAPTVGRGRREIL